MKITSNTPHPSLPKSILQAIPDPNFLQYNYFSIFPLYSHLSYCFISLLITRYSIFCACENVCKIYKNNNQKMIWKFSPHRQETEKNDLRRKFQICGVLEGFGLPISSLINLLSAMMIINIVREKACMQQLHLYLKIPPQKSTNQSKSNNSAKRKTIFPPPFYFMK